MTLDTILELRIKAGKSSGNKVLDFALSTGVYTADVVHVVITDVCALQKTLEEHRGKRIAIDYTVVGNMISSGGVAGIEPATHDTDICAYWGTLSRKGDVLLVERNPDKDFAKLVPHIVCVNTDNEHWSYEDRYFMPKPKSAYKKGNMPACSFLSKKCYLSSGSDCFSPVKDWTFHFDGDAEKLIQKLKEQSNPTKIKA